MQDRSRWTSEASGYVVAVVASVAALLLRLALSSLLGDKAPFFAFVLAVLITAWYAGFKPGVLATVLGTVLGTHFFIRPIQSWSAGRFEGGITVSLFFVIGLTASALCGALHASRRRIEEKQRQLEQAEDQILLVMKNVIDSIITIDGNGVVQSINPAGEKLFGHSASAVIGKNVNMLMPEPFSSEHDKYLANYFRTRQAKIIGIGREVVGRRKDGSTFPMDLAVGEFYTNQGHFFTGIVRDITERKQAEQALQDANRRKDEFLATLAHELRNPLAPIRNALGVMRCAGNDRDMMDQALGLMERQLGHMVRLVDDLLDVSRITSGKLHLRKELVELAAVMQTAIESARPIIEAREHELTTTFPPESIYLEADPTRLAQVFANLLSNAAKYTEPRGQIWLTAGRQGQDVVVSVRDTGIGIPAEHLPRLFEMFSQVAPALERSQGGLGIGLSLVRGLVELHAGTIEAHSAGHALGSEFIVRLPIRAASISKVQEPLDNGQALRSPARWRILVVDDNRDAADSLVKLLGLMGHESHAAYDGNEALEAAKTLRPDVLLLDIGLPKMNGYEVARRIRQQSWGRSMVLTALTGWGQEEDKRRAREAGFDHHLTKPAEPLHLENLLAHLEPTPRG